MHLYHLSLQRAAAITQAIFGNFSAPRAQEIIVARGKVLELLRPDDSGKLHSVVAVDTFSNIRSIAPFRLTAGNRDYIVVGSDSGRIVVLQFNPDKNVFDKVHQETFGKTGCRRIVPGQYIATDPKGRAILIGAIEKQKLVYVMNRDASARLTISSPLEAHKSHTIVFDIVGVDVGLDNPIFACLELDYAESDADPTGQAAVETEKFLTYYELDLGLNHVIRKWSEPTERSANLLIPVPGGGDGPGGVLVCAENWIVYKHQGHREVRTLIPRRYDTPEGRGVLVVAHATHKQRGLFFFLVQTEYGDLFKVTLDWEGTEVRDVRVKYFDTTPVATSLVITKAGFLFVASELGNHCLYQFRGIGDDDPTVEATSVPSEAADDATALAPLLFVPRAPVNLALCDEMDSLAPVLDMRAMDALGEEAPQLYAACGRASRSTLRVLRQGLPVTEIAVSDLPGNPTGVWTVKKAPDDAFDSYILISFTNATMVLAVGDTVEEVTDSVFVHTAATLAVTQLHDGALLQVHTGGLRHVRPDGRMVEWKSPGKKSIERAAVNARQVAVALAGGELIYFELGVDGALNQVEKRDLGVDVACMDIGDIPEGRQRSRYLALGGWDNTVRVLSLDPGDVLEQLGFQMVPVAAESVCLVSMQSATAESATGTAEHTTEFLNVGLSNGILMRTEIDATTGALRDTRTRFLGARPARLCKITLRGKRAVLAMSSRPWLCYDYQLKFYTTPLSYEPLEHAAGFASVPCPEGVVASSANTLRIFSLDRLGDVFNQRVASLRYTPRRLAVLPQARRVVVVEADHRAYNEAEKEVIRSEMAAAIAEVKRAEAAGDEAGGQAGGEAMDEDDDERDGAGPKGAADAAAVAAAAAELPAEELVGPPRPGEAGKWASCVRMLDAASLETLHVLELEDNEAALSVAACSFHDRGGEVFLVVGTAKDMQLHPRSLTCGFIHVYRLLEEGTRLQLLHKTETEDLPYALCEFQGRLLVGAGRRLRIYDLGKRKLLRKCECKTLPVFVATLHCMGDRVYVGDQGESFHFVKYNRSLNQLVVYADDVVPRHLVASCLLDYDTVATSDKFGNVSVLRLPADVSDEVENPAGTRVLWDSGHLNGAPNKLEQTAHFHVGEVVHSLQRVALLPGAEELLLYSTVFGSIGAFLPVTSREDLDFFQHLEMHMRAQNPSLTGRDHLSYRSTFVPVQHVVDGDLCEQYTALPLAEQKKIADELDRTPNEVLRKLEDIRNRVM